MGYRIAKPIELKVSDMESSVSASSARVPGIQRRKTSYLSNTNNGLKRRISKLMLQQ